LESTWVCERGFGLCPADPQNGGGN